MRLELERPKQHGGFIQLCPYRSALIDTDAVAAIQPWLIDQAFYSLAGANLRACIENYRRWGALMIVISGVIVPEGIYSQIEDLLNDTMYEWVFYGLQANEETIKQRIIKDHKLQDAAQRLQWLYLNNRVGELPGCRLIDTVAA